MLGLREIIMIDSASLAPRFCCPNCGTLYTVVPVEPDDSSDDCDVACMVCGLALPGREGGLVRKYFLLRRTGSVERGRYTVV
jgi:transcription elongation factor Elf1